MQTIPGECSLPFPSIQRNSHLNIGVPYQKKKYPTVQIPGVRETISHGQQSDPRANKNTTKRYPHHGSSGRNPKYPLSRVPQEPAPEISSEELTLPRVYRITLSQFRSRHCIALNDYRPAIGLSHGSFCPACGNGDPHTVTHLFSWPAHPPKLVARDL